MKYGFTTVKVKNLEESIKFYTHLLKLEEVTRFSPQPGKIIVFLKDEDDNLIELIEDESFKGKGNNTRVSIGFTVENLDKILNVVQERDIEILTGPVETPDGVKFVYIKDPNGIPIEFIEGFDVESF